MSVPARQIRLRYSAGTVTVTRRTPADCAAGSGSRPIRGTLHARPDDVDHAVVAVDDVPLRLGHQARALRVLSIHITREGGLSGRYCAGGFEWADTVT